jgi:hypothetical protein
MNDLDLPVRRDGAALRLALTLLRDAVSGAMENFRGFCKLRQALRAKPSITCYLQYDLGFLNQQVHRELMQQVTPLRRMLTSLIQKVDAERQLSKK